MLSVFISGALNIKPSSVSVRYLFRHLSLSLSSFPHLSLSLPFSLLAGAYVKRLPGPGFILLKSGLLPAPLSWKQLEAVCHCSVPVSLPPIALSLYGRNMLPTFWHHSYMYIQCGGGKADNLTILWLTERNVCVVYESSADYFHDNSLEK